MQRLRPRDIAILVRTGTEAAAMRRALQKRNVASVYLSDKDSVFQSDEARDLVHWLRAVAAPQDATLVRAALALASVGLPLDTLAQLASDDVAFDQWADDLRQLRHYLGQSGRAGHAAPEHPPLRAGCALVAARWRRAQPDQLPALG